MLKLAGLYGAQGRYDQYDPLLFELLETCRRVHGEGSTLTKFARIGLEVRVRQLSELAKEQEASGDREGAAVTLSRLEQIRQALNGDTDAPTKRLD
jgi:hypothetical protein